jgi:hypothetical protein
MPMKYIGTDQADQRAEDLEKLGISDLWTPHNHYRWSRSRYDGHLSATVDFGHRPRFFMGGMCYNFCPYKLVDYMVHHLTYA